MTTREAVSAASAPPRSSGRGRKIVRFVLLFITAVVLVVAIAAITDSEIEIVVRAKQDHAPVVIEIGFVDFEDDLF